MGRTQAVALGLVLAAILVGAGLGSNTGPVSSMTVTSASTVPSAADPPGIRVYVSGEVAMPGVVEVGEGSIVADAVAAAGGVLEEAQLDAINLARPLVEGDHIHIPGPGDSASSPAEATESDGGLISPNRADASQLEELPGVGPVLAQRIVDHREANGPFQTVEDLLEVPGIGEAKLAALRDFIVVP